MSELGMDMMDNRIITDSLGFPLNVEIIVSNLGPAGSHVTYETPEGEVTKDAKHTIRIRPGLSDADIAEVASHEVYHLFYSVRHLITADEETECEVFGQLVRRIHAATDKSQEM